MLQAAICLHNIKRSWCVSTLREPYWYVLLRKGMMQKTQPEFSHTSEGTNVKIAFSAGCISFSCRLIKQLLILQGVSVHFSCIMNTEVSRAKSTPKQSFQLCKTYFYPISAFRTNLQQEVQGI